MEFTYQINFNGDIVPKTGLTAITEQRIAQMPVSDAMRLMRLIASEYQLNLSRHSESKIAYRMLVHFAKYN